jgi:UDP-glucuronate 4-epimerase
MLKTVLVTGSAGFIGSHLCERLIAQGLCVIGLDNFCDSYDPALKRSNISEALLSPSYILVEGDILDGGLLNSLFESRSIDAVVHLAALAGVRRSLENPLDYVDVDIKGTVNMLELCRRYSIKKFVFASSSSVYGSNPPPFSEDKPPAGQASPYAAAKYSGELFCRTYSQLYSLPAVCLRFFTVYGPRQRPDMAIRIFTQALHDGRELCIFGDGSSSRDYTYVDDVVDGIIAALNLDCSFEAINLGSAKPVKLSELISLIGNKLSSPARIIYLPKQAGDVPQTCADIQKAEKLLGYSPKISLDEGLERFVTWYREFCRKKEQAMI